MLPYHLRVYTHPSTYYIIYIHIIHISYQYQCQYLCHLCLYQIYIHTYVCMYICTYLYLYLCLYLYLHLLSSIVYVHIYIYISCPDSGLEPFSVPVSTICLHSLNSEM